LIFRRLRLGAAPRSRKRRLAILSEPCMIVTIDGPAGAGKSTAARALAQRLGFEFLDTGAMFRAVALAALRARIDVRDEAALAPLVDSLQLEMPTGRVLLNGEDVSGLIRTAEVTNTSGLIARSPAVRRRLAELQREIARGRNMVCEGRDQGTVVFSDAGCKFFLVADPQERARRRQKDMLARGEKIELSAILQAQQERDRRDASRDIAPMKPADDAILLDSTGLTIEQVVEQMEKQVRTRL
jgi:cytidylate kinase